jgi:hypothetical protein
MPLLTNSNQVVAGEALVAMSLAKQAANLLNTACQSMGCDVRTLSNPLPTKRKDLEQVVDALNRASALSVRVVMRQFPINQQAAVAYLPVVIDELTEQTDALITRAEAHLAACKRANVTSVPQADGDDGQLTDAQV